MLQLSGIVFNVFKTKVGKNQHGDIYGGDHKVQLLSDVPTEDGTVKKELLDLKVKDISPYQKNQFKPCTVPVGAFAPGKGHVVFFVTGDPIFSEAENLSGLA